MTNQNEIIRQQLRILHQRDPRYLDPNLFLFKDVLIYGWILQLRSKKQEIDRANLLRYCSTTSAEKLNLAVSFWRGFGFFDDTKYSRGILSFTMDDMAAIEAVISEPEFAYNPMENLPGTDLKTLDFIKYVNLMEKPKLRLANVIVSSLAEIFGIGWVPIRTPVPDDILTVCEVTSSQGNVWLGVTVNDGTLSYPQLVQSSFPLIQACINGHAKYSVLVFPSIDDADEEVDIFNDNPQFFGMSELVIGRFLHLASAYKTSSQLRPDADFLDIFDPKVATSFNYPANYALSRILK